MDSKKSGSIDQEALIKFLQAHWDDSIFPRDAVVRWFERIHREDNVALKPADLERLTRVLYKVVNPVLMTPKLDASDSDIGVSRRRVEYDEVLELIGKGLEEDTATGVMRIHARSLKEGDVGYVTVKGNQGTVFVEAGGATFIVQKETTLDETSSVSAAGDEKEESHKLKEGEILEVLEHPKKDEASGDWRTKLKSQTSGRVGWATSVSSQGRVFLKVV